MGQLQQGRDRHIGPGVEGRMGILRSEQLLIIFKGPLFEPAEHGVRNPGLMPGRDPQDFPGLDSKGWGLFPNGVITCINMPMCANGFSINNAVNWTNFWNLNASADEMAMSIQNGVEGRRRFLGRLIIPVRLDMSGIQFVPDPSIWLVSVPLSDSQSVKASSVGRLVPWPAPTPDVERLLNMNFALRSGPEFAGREDAPWPAKRSPTGSTTQAKRECQLKL